MIYLEGFDIFKDEDKLIKEMIDYISQYFRIENTFIEIDTDIKHNLIDYSRLSNKNYTYVINKFNKKYDKLVSNPKYTQLVNGDISTNPIYNVDIYNRVDKIFHMQQKKWVVYRYLSELIKSFTMYSTKSERVSNRIMNIVGMGNDPKQIWEEFNNIQNDEFSYFKYPNTLDMNRLYDMLISDYEFDLNKRGEYELSRTIMLLKKNDIEIIEKI